MNLAPGGGELERHTDQVDPDAGVNDAKLMRFHFPIVTNTDCYSSVNGTMKLKEFLVIWMLVSVGIWM